MWGKQAYTPRNFRTNQRIWNHFHDIRAEIRAGNSVKRNAGGNGEVKPKSSPEFLVKGNKNQRTPGPHLNSTARFPGLEVQT